MAEKERVENGERGVDIEEVLREKEELEKRCRELEDYAKRLRASFENYKNEVAREKQEIIKNANEYLINRLIPVLEDFERALKNAEPSWAFIEGMERIYRKLMRILENEGLKVIEPEGKFDPFEHEAFERVETEEHEEYTVLEVLERGYKYHGKVMKPAKVKVAVRPREKGGDES